MYMHKYRLLFAAFGAIILLGALHLVASAFYFYWTVAWFDTMMHFLGGLSLGFFAIWFWYDSPLFDRRIPTKREVFLAAFLSIIFIGIGWEFFEYVYGISAPSAGQTFGQDTFCDLIADLCGASLAGVAGRLTWLYE